MWMWHLGAWCNNVHGGLKLKVGPDDLRGLFQLKQFHNSVLSLVSWIQGPGGINITHPTPKHSKHLKASPTPSEIPASLCLAWLLMSSCIEQAESILQLWDTQVLLSCCGGQRRLWHSCVFPERILIREPFWLEETFKRIGSTH